MSSPCFVFKILPKSKKQNITLVNQKCYTIQCEIIYQYDALCTNMHKQIDAKLVHMITEGLK